ncbi:MAG: short-chain dehydrogenase/reductase [Bradyrhizobium sp.]|nr:short-chain dehydrogenase/reductase [Bradyrhizobium sp.]
MSVGLFDLSGKVALVTGASSGLGAHFAKVLAGAGARVVIAARREARLQALARDISIAGGSCETLLLDVTDSAAIETAGERLKLIDILVNNAGLVREGAAVDQSQADWDSVIDTNLKGVFLLAQATARAMRDRGHGGTIINIASILGLRQAAGVLPYAVSKAGVIQMTKTLALEWARFGIRVNALAPGYFSTEINADFWGGETGRAMVRRIPQRRLGQLEDLSGPLLLLASEASAYMTGTVLAVDGGHLVSGL